MTFSAAAAERIRQWGMRLTQTFSIRLRTTSDPRTGDFKQFLQEFADCAGNVRIIAEEDESHELPAILVSSSLTYQALPHDQELAPFLEILTWSHGGVDPLEPALEKGLAGIAWPADVRLFIAAACPHCPEAVRRIAPLAFHQPWIRITIVDGLLFPEVSEPFGIRSVPTLVLDEGFRWTGTLDMHEFMETLIHRDVTRLPASSLKTLLKDGQADRLAEMMLDRDQIFPAFMELVTHPDWSVRLGAVVVAEEIVEKNPTLADSILPPLWERFSGADVTVKGDILYLIGLAGSAEQWADPLRGVLSSDLPDDLREGAQEALDRWNAKKDD